MSDDTEAGAQLLSPRRRPAPHRVAAGSRGPGAGGGGSRQRILCYDRRYFCRVTLWLELMVGIIMTILGLFILLLSIESLKEGDYPAVYFCSSFIALGVVLLLVYYIHYYALKYSIKRHVQRLDASIKSDQDALAALARRSLQLSKIAVPRSDPPNLLGRDGSHQPPLSLPPAPLPPQPQSPPPQSPPPPPPPQPPAQQAQTLPSLSRCVSPPQLQRSVADLPSPSPPASLMSPAQTPSSLTLVEEAALVIPARLSATLPQSFSDFDLWDTRQSVV